jgi:hypothetical protein
MPDALFTAAERAIPADGAIWAVIPRKATSRGKAFPYPFEVMQAAGLRIPSLVDNKDLKFTDQEYGVRSVVRKGRRAAKGQR